MDEPTASEQAEQRRRELLLRLLATDRANDRAGERAGGASAIQPTGLRAGPASAGQRRLWLANELEPGNTAYHIVAGWRWSGTADAQRLAAALATVAGRHQVLRTGFAMVGHDLIARVNDDCELAVPVHVLAAELDPAVAWRASASRPFDLASGPLIRAELFRQVGVTDDVLVLTVHHIAYDGVSARLLTDELVAAYQTADMVVERPAPALQYLDYAIWQHDRLAAGAYEAELTYWQQALAGAPVTALPTDRPRRPGAAGPGRLLRLPVAAELAGAVRKLAGQQRATPFMVGLAAYALLLARYTGEQDVLIGTAVSGREHPDTAQLIGFFVNTVVLRIDLTGQPSFAELVGRVRTACGAAFAHQQVPFDSVVQRLQPDRAAAGNPLFQTFFAYQGASLLGPATNYPFQLVDVGLEAAGFDLAITVDDTGAQPHLLCEYATDLFEESSIDRLLEHYLEILQAATATPDRRLHELAAVPWQRRELLAPTSSQLVPDLLQQQADRQPAAVAVVDGSDEISFGELDRRANQLAWRMLEHGVGPEDRVAVCLDREAGLLVALLAVFKLGAAYVPLDPSYPPQRLADLLADTGPRLLVTRQRHAARLARTDLAVIDLDIPIEPDRPHEAPPRSLHPDNLAYVLHTSGSTGRPKGAMVEHGSLASYCLAVAERFELGPTDRFLQYASISFDVAVEEIWPTWCLGAAVVLLPEGPLLGPDEFTKLLGERRVSVVELPTAYWHEWTAWLDQSGCPLPDCLRLVIIGGERVLPDRLHSWQRTGVELAHVYGLTETTVTSTVHPPGLVARQQQHWANLPIGTALATTEVQLLDSRLEPVPVGVPGEVYLGGLGIGRGYFGRPGLTAQRFVAHPAPRLPGERLYRTGDLARYLPDGALEFLGRLDDQTKIRGFRVEPAEIASVLAEHPLVGDAVVVVREHDNGDRYLAGYVVPASRPDGAAAGELSVAELVAHQRRRLPGHLVVQAIGMLSSFPLQPNGKIDKRALLPIANRATDPDDGVARTETERLLCAVVAEVLGRPSIGVHTNFFQAGGDSIAAIRLVSAANRAGLQLSPREVFEQQTVAQLATVARPATAVHASQSEVLGTAPATPIQRWYLANAELDRRGFIIGVQFELDPAISAVTVQQAVLGLLSHHDALRVRFLDGEHGPLMDNLPLPPTAPVTVIEIGDPAADRQPTELASLASLASLAAASLDPAAGRLVAGWYARAAGDRPGQLFLALHHLVVDAVSLELLVADLQTLLSALHCGSEPVLPAKTTEFIDWARRLDHHARSAETLAELPYWQRVVGSPAGALPRDRAGGANSEDTVATHDRWLDEQLTAAITELLPARHRTRPVEVLIAALAASVAGWAGADEILVELEGHGRESIAAEVDVSRTVGWFTASYPVRLPARQRSSADHLQAVKELLRAVPRNGIGYGLLRQIGAPDELAPVAAEVSFNYLGRWQVAGSPAGLVRPVAAEPIALAGTGRRAVLLEVNAALTGGRLRISWTHSREVHQPATIAALADRFVAELGSLVSAAQAGDALIASDFPLVELDRPALAALLEQAGDIETIVAPTAAQQAVLELAASCQDRRVQVMHSVYQLAAGTDLARLRQAWTLALRRFAVLRAGFPPVAGTGHAVLVVHREVELPWRVLDRSELAWSQLSPADRLALVEDVLAGHDQLAAEPAAPSLMRLCLIQLADRALLAWSYHHLLLDGWSDSLVLDAVATAYADAGFQTSPAPASDVDAWEGFARASRSGQPAATTEPGSIAAGDRGWFRQPVAADLVQQLTALAATAGLTLGVLTHAAWALVLSEQLDGAIEFGTSITGRSGTIADVDHLVGALARTVRLQVPRPPTGDRSDWLAWFGELRRALIEAEAAPALTAASWCQRPVLAATVMAYENFPTAAAAAEQVGALRLTHLHSRQERIWPLMLMIIPEQGGLSLVVTYDAGRASAGLVEALVQDYLAALGRLAEVLTGPTGTGIGTGAGIGIGIEPNQPAGVGAGSERGDRR